MDEPLFRLAISVFTKPLMRYITKGIFLMMNNYAKKALRLFATLARQLNAGKKKQAMPSAFTPRQVKTYATDSAV